MNFKLDSSDSYNAAYDDTNLYVYVLIGGVKCNGTESELIKCPHDEDFYPNQSHHYDVGLSCKFKPADTCEICEMGSYGNWNESRVCLQCPEGFTTTSVGESACNICAKDYYGDGKHCDMCGEGSITEGVGSNSSDLCLCDIGFKGAGNNCTSCGEGGTTYKLESDHCSCYVSYYDTDNGCVSCPAGATTEHPNSNSSKQCMCDIGYFGPSNSSGKFCQSCGEGGTTDGIGQETCVCSTSYFMTPKGCESCGPHATTKGPGSNSSLDCFCKVGYYGNAETPYSCLQCPATFTTTVNKYKNISDCVCGEGWYSVGGPIIAVGDIVLGGGTCLKPPYIVDKFLACCLAGLVIFFPLAFIFFDYTFDKTRRGKIEGRRAQKVQVFGQVRRDEEQAGRLYGTNPRSSQEVLERMTIDGIRESLLNEKDKELRPPGEDVGIRVQTDVPWEEELRPSFCHEIVTKALQEGARRKNVNAGEKIVDKALAENARGFIKSYTGFTLIAESIAVGNLSIERYEKLKRAESDPKVITSLGSTTLMLAVENGMDELIPHLINAGVDVNARDAFGRNALHRGIIAGSPTVVAALAPHGIDMHAVDAEGRRPVDIAITHGNAMAAYSIGGAAAAMVPGYVSPSVQGFQETCSLWLDIGSHFADVISDYSLLFALIADGRTLLAYISATFIWLPVVVMAAMPYQTMFERAVTICNMRLVYEALRSMGQERFTLFYGACHQFHTILEDLPQLVFQGVLISLNIISIPSLYISFGLGLYSASSTLREFYLQKYFVDDLRRTSESATWKGVTLLYTLLSVALKLGSFIFALSQNTRAFVIYISVAFVFRIQLFALSEAPMTPAEPFSALLTDAAIIEDPSAFMVLTFISNVEVATAAVLAVIKYVPDDPYLEVGGDAVNREILGLPSSFFFISLFLFCLTLRFILALTIWLSVHRGDARISMSDFCGVFAFWRSMKELLKMASIFTTFVSNSYTFFVAQVGALWHMLRSDGEDEGGRGMEQEEPTKGGEGRGLEDPLLDGGRVRKKRRFPRPWSALCPLLWWVPCMPNYRFRDSWAYILPWSTTFLMLSHWYYKYQGCAAGRSEILPCYPDQPNPDPDHCDVILQDPTDLTFVYECVYTCDCSFGCPSDFWIHFFQNVAPYVAIVLYIGYVYEAIKCPAARALGNLRGQEEGYKSYLKATGVTPEIKFYSQAYHYETTYYTDSNGNTKSETKKVVTREVTSYFSFTCWKDDSENFPDVNGILRVHPKDVFGCHDDFTSKKLDDDWEQFKRGKKDRGVGGAELVTSMLTRRTLPR